MTAAAAVLDALDAKAVVNAHARWIIGKYDLEGARPLFARNAVSDCVHVLAPGETQPPHESHAAGLLDFHLGRHVMVCGSVVTFNRGGMEKSGHLVAHFDDDTLCRRCVKAFGQRAWILFHRDCRPDTRPDIRTEPEETMNRYLVTFDRIGRTHNLTMSATVADPQALTGQIAKFARPYLRSRLFEVTIDTDTGEGIIMCGGNNGGTFTFAAANDTPSGTSTDESADAPAAEPDRAADYDVAAGWDRLSTALVSQPDVSAGSS